MEATVEQIGLFSKFSYFRFWEQLVSNTLTRSEIPTSEKEKKRSRSLTVSFPSEELESQFVAFLFFQEPPLYESFLSTSRSLISKMFCVAPLSYSILFPSGADDTVKLRLGFFSFSDVGMSPKVRVLETSCSQKRK